MLPQVSQCQGIVGNLSVQLVCSVNSESICPRHHVVGEIKAPQEPSAIYWEVLSPIGLLTNGQDQLIRLIALPNPPPLQQPMQQIVSCLPGTGNYKACLESVQMAWILQGFVRLC